MKEGHTMTDEELIDALGTDLGLSWDMVAMPALKQACRAAILELRLGIKAGDVPNTPRLRGIVWALENAADRA
jgi:hypothetical protein